MARSTAQGGMKGQTMRLRFDWGWTVLGGLANEKSACVWIQAGMMAAD